MINHIDDLFWRILRVDIEGAVFKRSMPPIAHANSAHIFDLSVTGMWPWVLFRTDTLAHLKTRVLNICGLACSADMLFIEITSSVRS